MDSPPPLSPANQKKQTPRHLFTALNPTLLTRMLDFLDKTDVLSLRLLNKTSKSSIASYEGWAEFIIHKYLPCLDPDLDKDDDSTCTTHTSSFLFTKLSNIKCKSNLLWFSYFKSVAILTSPCQVEEGEDAAEIKTLLQAVSRDLLRALKETVVPPLELTKAYPRVRTSSSFQTFLVDRLRQENRKQSGADGGSLGGLGPLDDLPEDDTPLQLEDWCNGHLDEIESFTAGDETPMLLKLRWYLLDSTIGDILDIVDDEDAQRNAQQNAEGELTLSIGAISVVQASDLNNKFLSIMVHIGKTIKWYCKVAKLVLQTQNDNTNILTLYTKLFQRFTYACLSYSKNYEFLEDNLNRFFKETFPAHPQFPQFSLWRMFTRIWVSDVFEPLHEALNKEALAVLLRVRTAGAEKILNKSKKQNEEIESKPTYFNPSPLDIEVMVLQEFTASLVDISFQEINIHYISHSRILKDSDTPYTRFEAGFLSQSHGFVLGEYWTKMKQQPNTFDLLLETETKLISQIFLNRTYLQYHEAICETANKRAERAIGDLVAAQSTIEEIISDSVPEDDTDVRLLSEIICSIKNPGSKREKREQCFDEILCHRTNSVSSEEYLGQAKQLLEQSGSNLVHLLQLYRNSVLINDPRKIFFQKFQKRL